MEVIEEVFLDPSSFDVFIRMNGNADNDYCFQVSESHTFKDLIKIFETLPVMLNLSIFYDRIPIGFKVSHYPGNLTRTGGILFGREADFEEYLKSVPLQDKLLDHLLPGQLIVPVFRERKLFHLATIATLIGWLYTDLPDFISPTPGLCLTNHLTVVITWFLKEILDKPDKAQKFYDEIFAPVGQIGQCIYFAFHIFKVLLFYFILWAGLFNPYSFRGRKAINVDKDQLVAIGWTGSKKVSNPFYQDEFRKINIDKAGGVLKAYTIGLFPVIRNCVIELHENEGYATGLKIESPNENLFQLSKSLLDDQKKFFAKSLQGLEPAEAFERIKKFRKYGPLELLPSLQPIIDAKFSPMDEQIRKEQESKKDK